LGNGILFTQKEDGNIFLKVLEDINFMSENFQSENVGLREKISNFMSEKSYCIRCKAMIDYNPNHPLCNTCYQIWAQFKNSDYPERYCHGCGMQSKTLSYSRPLCNDCFQNHH